MKHLLYFLLLTIFITSNQAILSYNKNKILSKYKFHKHYHNKPLQPGLRQAGVDTRSVDKHLKAAYDHYGMLKEQTQAGIRVADGVAAHVRAGYAYA